MNRLFVFEATVFLALAFVVTGCGNKVTAETIAIAGTGTAPTQVASAFDSNNFRVDHPEQFPLVSSGEHVTAPELNVTGVIIPMCRGRGRSLRWPRAESWKSLPG
jgi:hypothetical protein